MKNQNLSVKEQVAMILRRSPLRLIKRCVARCTELGLDVTHDYLEAHHLCGGDIEDLVDGIEYCQQMKMNVTLDEMAARQLYEKHEGGRTLVTNLREFHDAGIWDLSHQPMKLLSQAQ